MNKKQRLKNRATAAKLRLSLPVEKQFSKCINCGEYGAHFVPPCFGESGFFHCESSEFSYSEKEPRIEQTFTYESPSEYSVYIDGKFATTIKVTDA